MLRLILILPFGFLLGLLQGCGPGRGEVHGQVTYQGKAVSRGSVVMVGDDRKPIVGRIEADGKYSIQGVPAGIVRIAVLSPNPGEVSNSIRRSPQNMKGPANFKSKFGSQIAQSDELETGGKGARSKWFRLPQQYEDPDTSGITTEIRRGDNAFNIELR
jgi:hypothetical protein